MKKYILIVFIFIFLFSCSSKKDIVLMQNLDNISDLNFSYKDYLVSIDDILKIDVGSDNPDATLIYNHNGSNNSYLNTKDGLVFNGYLVDSEGFIFFPSIGKISVVGKDIKEIREIILSQIIDNGILINPSVDIKILNSHFTILGEVKIPGKYDYIQNNLNILEAIGMAGDLTINGKRNNIRLLRQKLDKIKVFEIDLTKSNFIENDAFQIISGDIIIVNPNTNRIKNAGIIGNSGTLLSLLSFLLTSIILISNNN